MSETGTDGRIFTFYSYKGGTGRSMALANVAWMLAAAGKRVLAIDWDMEAPGLHRYFHPFLDDPEATSTPGVIDFVTEFAMAAIDPAAEQEPDWYLPYADLGRYAVSLRTDLFQAGATLDFIPAGQQGPAYASRVNSFDWQSFWDRMGGAALIREMRAGLRVDYDYILIDSRTGVSDTSGICTIALPDALVVAFTLNRQSIRGAAAVAQSVVASRDRSRFRVYPVPMRVEFAEKDRLELARDDAQRAFNPLLSHIPVQDRERYWGSVEIVYHAYYAYEEVLAVFADRPERRTSLLAGFERIADLLTEGQVTAAVPPPESKRREILARYQRQPALTAHEPAVDALPREEFVFVSTSRQAEDFVKRLTEELETGPSPIRVWTPERDLLPGDSWAERVEDAIRDAVSVLIPVSEGDSQWQTTEWTAAVSAGTPVTQLVLTTDALRPLLGASATRTIDFSSDFGAAMEGLRQHLTFLRSAEGQRATLTLQLENAKRARDAASSDTETLQRRLRVEDLERRLAALGAEGYEPVIGLDEVTVQVGADDRIEARWGKAQVTSGASVDDIGRRVLTLMSRWAEEGRLTKRTEFETLGELLYTTIFPGAVNSLLEQALEGASSQRRLRLVVSFDEGRELGKLPWEFILKPSTDGRTGVFLATRADLVVSRVLALAETLPAPRIEPGTARVLVGAWGPRAGDAAIKALEALGAQNRVESTILRDGALSELLDRIESDRPAVLHLAAPVRYGPDGLEIETSTDNISSGHLLDLISGLERRPPVIVVEFDQPNDAPLTHEVAIGLARLSIAAVLDVPSRLGPREANAFYRGFYGDLLDGAPIDVAVARGRRNISRESSSGLFGLPVLYMNHPGPVAHVHAGAPPTPPPAADTPAPKVDPAIRTRLQHSLESAQPWRTLKRIAIEAAIPEETAASVLRSDPDVRFSVGRSGDTIVGLISRVGS
jgi:cellulose biosynthesis protein BcsQ